eukprot:CAMPEP_0183555500 /NCGR_PEP_ID=MMETSP0371-20130417/79578_1 /TAXON_ID=268820 /ORGANISM="Peridinium aciculiferum, Strain PAER-2" /LENGTH=61 /DNA_ID=CAMNT_0025761711 /DNA_START=60 /DNA_END=242 /DNA_ORIENTATION=+
MRPEEVLSAALCLDGLSDLFSKYSSNISSCEGYMGSKRSVSFTPWYTCPLGGPYALGEMAK